MNEDFPKLHFEKATIDIKSQDRISEKADILGFFVCKHLCKYSDEFHKRPEYNGRFNRHFGEICEYCPIMKMLF